MMNSKFHFPQRSVTVVARSVFRHRRCDARQLQEFFLQLRSLIFLVDV